VAPVHDGKGLGEASDAGKEVFFSGADRTFHRICAMYVWWCILEASLLGLDEVLDLVRCLVVHFATRGTTTATGDLTTGGTATARGSTVTGGTTTGEPTTRHDDGVE